MKQPMSLKKRTVIQDVLVVLFVAVALFSVLLTVLSLIPERAGLVVREEVVATSARVSIDEDLWQVSVRGRLRNTSDKPVTVTGLTITVKGSSDTKLTSDKVFTLAPREDYDLMLSGVLDHAVDGTPEVTAVVDGASVYLRNPADTPLIATLFPLVFAILFSVLSVRAVKVLRLLLQEARMG